MAIFPFDFESISEAVIAPFGESVQYRFNGGTARTITVDVDRTDRAQFAGTDRSMAGSAVITVRNHATAGVLSTEINTGGSEVLVSLRVGQTAKWCKVLQVFDTDPGWVSFEVQ